MEHYLARYVMKVERAKEQNAKNKKKTVVLWRISWTFSFKNYVVYGCVDVNGFFKMKNILGVYIMLVYDDTIIYEYEWIYLFYI